MCATRSQPSEGEWLEQRSLIRYEYLVKNTTLKDLITLLRAQGLHATKGQLVARLKSWNFFKYIDQATWQHIDHKIRKRKEEGKNSDVILCGRKLKKAKVTKETNRHRETNIFAQLKTPPSSPGNPQLIICTPPAYDLSSTWPLSLPWIRLQNTLWNTTINVTASGYMTLQKEHPADVATLLMMHMLTLREDCQSISLSELIAGANNLIPEWYHGEHVEIAQNMLTGPSSECTSECFKVMVYMMSNSILVPDNKHLDFIFSFMRNGIIDTWADLKKLHNENPTIRAFFESLFQSTIKEIMESSYDDSIGLSTYLDRVTWLLEVGSDPNCYCHVFWNQDLATPIQQAVDAGLIELVQLLLRFNARADLPQGSTVDKAFINLALQSRGTDAGRLRMLNLLFDHKFLSNDEMLRAAIELRDTELMLKILQDDPNVTSYETAWLDPTYRSPHGHDYNYLTDPSALMMAVQAGGEMADSMLDYLLLKGQPTPAILADAYMAAAYGGHYSIILRLDKLHSSREICNRKGIAPLQVAVAGGDLRVCQHLKRYGGSSTSLLLIAARLLNTEVLRLLIDYGDNLNDQICEYNFSLYDYVNILPPRYKLPSTILSILIHESIEADLAEKIILMLIKNEACLSRGDIAELSRRGLHKCLEAALSVGGNPNDQDASKRTALQCALDDLRSFSGDDQISTAFRSVELLIERGAELSGGEVVRAIELQSKDLILYLLRHGGTLTDFDGAGRGCLEAEIIARNDPCLQEALEMQDFAIDAGPFCAAIDGQDWALVGRLFERTHKPTSCHVLEGTAVGLAAKAGQLEILGRLLNRFNHSSVLHSAILPFRLREGGIIPLDSVQKRLGYWRASPYQSGPILIEASPLTLATLDGDTRGFRDLLRRGCCMDRVAWDSIAKSDKSSEYVELLREFDCGLGSSTKYDSEMETALCQAIRARKTDVAKYLMEVRADVNEFDIRTAARISPLQCATMEGNIDMAIYLLDNGANINAPPAYNKGATALQYAAINGYIGFARHLIQLGAHVNARGSSRFGRSALEGAAEHGRLDILALLVHHGAVTSGLGRQQLINSVAFAQKRAHTTTAEWLKKTCGWSEAEQHHLEFVDADADYPVRECIRAYCCDEYHDTDTQCVYHYTEEQRKIHYDDCKRCEEIRYYLDDSSESNLSSEDEEMDSEWVDDDQETAQRLDVMEQGN